MGGRIRFLRAKAATAFSAF